MTQIKADACAVCYGSGKDVTGKPCPFGCTPGNATPALPDCRTCEEYFACSHGFNPPCVDGSEYKADDDPVRLYQRGE